MTPDDSEPGTDARGPAATGAPRSDPAEARPAAADPAPNTAPAGQPGGTAAAWSGAAASAQPPRSGPGTGLLAGLLVAAALAGGGVALLGQTLLGAPPADPALTGLPEAVGRLGAEQSRLAGESVAATETIRALEARLAALEARPSGDTGPLAAQVEAAQRTLALFAERLAAVEGALPPEAPAARPLPGPESDLGVLSDALTEQMRGLAELRAQIAALQAADPATALAPQLAALDASIAALAQRVAALEALDLQGLVTRAALGLTLAQLTRAADTSAPFAETLAVFADVAPGDPLVAVLAPMAETGVATRGELADRFATVIAAVIAAERGASSASWMDQAWAGLNSIVSVRETGEVTGDSAEAIVARAELRLGEGRLAEAVDELAGLSGAPAEAAAAWLAEARRRLALETAIAELNARLLDAAAPARQR